MDMYMQNLNCYQPGLQLQILANQTVLLEQVSLDWLSCQQTLVKESTYNKYKNLVYSYIILHLGEIPVSTFTNETIERFCQALLLEGGKRKTGLSPKTVSDVHSVMRRLLEYTTGQEYHPNITARKITVKQEDKELRVLSCMNKTNYAHI